MNLKSARQQVNITQEQLAKMLSIDRSTIAKWETGKAKPRAELLPKIAQTLHCTIDELFAAIS